MRQLAHFHLVHVAERKQSPRQRRSGDVVQKVALILCRVRGFQKLRPGRCLPQARVMAGGDQGTAQTVHVVQADAEFDLAVAENVRIRSPAGGVFAQEMRKDPLAVLRGTRLVADPATQPTTTAQAF